MKFCLVTTFYPPHAFGGDAVFVQQLAQAVARRGHDVHVVYDRSGYDLLGRRGVGMDAGAPPNLTVHVLGGGWGGAAGVLFSHQLGRPRRRLRALLDGTDFDVVHFHNISLMGGPGVLRHGRAVKLCSLHDYWFVCAAHVLWRYGRAACVRRTCVRCALRAGRPPQWWRYTGAVGRAVRHVDAFIAGSELTRRLHAQNGFPAAIHCLPNFAPAPSDLPPSTSPPQDRPYFLYVGRLETLKGVHVLIEQLRAYRAADVLIVGAGREEAALRRQAAGLDHVRFLGWRDRSALEDLYRHALALLVPSLCYEICPLVALEALAVGTPVIARNGGAMAEIVAGGAGTLYGSAEELLAALHAVQEPQVRQRMADAARRVFAERYSEAVHLERYFALIEACRAAGAGRR